MIRNNEVPNVPKHLLTLIMRGPSACPDTKWMDRIAFRRKPFPEDQAILEAWQWRMPTGSVVTA